MKRFIALLLCLLLLAACVPALAEGAAIKADWMPSEARQFFTDPSFNGWTIDEAATVLVENTVGGTFYFAVAQKAGHNVLYGFQMKNEHFEYWLRTDSAISQGRGDFRLDWNSGDVHLLSDQVINIGEGFSVMFIRADNEEQADNELYFSVNSSGQFHLKLAFVRSCWEEVQVSPEALAYSFEGEYEGTAYGTVETNLRYFSYDAFPKTLKEARQSLSNPPAIPAGELTAQKIKFTGGQKFPVYSGPGAEYLRAADGRAIVSTNDWIQVFGSERGYILIQYDITSSQMRFGWIDQSALPKSAQVSALHFAYADAEITGASTLTDDPLNSRTTLCSVSSGQQVKWLAAMGSWVYVETSDFGQPIRGFVPANCVRQKPAGQTLSGFYQGSDYTAQAQATLVPGANAEITVTVAGPAAWKTAGADRITSYQLYANNVPVNALCSVTEDPSSDHYECTFTLSASIPGGAAILGLCPVKAITGAAANETLLILITDGQAQQQTPQSSVYPTSYLVMGESTAFVNNPDPNDRLHLRTQPDGSAKSLGKYYNGTIVVILPDTDESSGWTHVRIGGTEGYMQSKYLLLNDGVHRVAPDQPVVVIDNQAGTGLNLRTGQSTDSEVIRLLENGSNVTVLGISEEWLHVMDGIETGYIKATGVTPRLAYMHGTPGGSIGKARVIPYAISVYQKPMNGVADDENGDDMVMGCLDQGDIVTVYSIQDGYALVSYGSQRYWAQANQLEMLDE